MKTLAKVLMLVVLALSVSNVFAQNKGDDNIQMKKIQSLNNKLSQAIVDGNDEMVFSFYTSDAVSLPNYNTRLNGIDAIKKHQQEAKQMGNKVSSMKFVTISVEEYGNALVEVGTYDLTMEMKDAPKPLNDKGKYLTIWEKQSDGSYKMAYEIWNSDANPAKRMKGGQNVTPEQRKQNQDQRLNQKDNGQTKSGEKNPNKEQKK